MSMRKKSKSSLGKLLGFATKSTEVIPCHYCVLTKKNFILQKLLNTKMLKQVEIPTQEEWAIADD